MSYLRPPTPNSTFADGSLDFDGAATVLGVAPVAGVYTLTSCIIADTITIRTGARVIPGQYFVMARVLTIETGAFLSANGNNASGLTAGGSILAGGYLGWAAGGGGTGNTRNTITTVAGATGSGSGGSSVGGTGGSGGNGDTIAGGAGNASAALAANQLRYWRSPLFAANGWKMPPTATGTTYTLVNAGGGGGSGGLRITAAGGDSLNSGAGGGSGGILCVYAGVLNNQGTIEALGGNGSNATVGGPAVTGTVGGGGGGAGGAIHLTCDRLVSAGTFSVAGGSGGAGAGSVLANATGFQGSPGTLCLFLRGEAI